jgi:5'-nucleotidase
VRILLSNADGIEAAGLRALEEAVAPFGEVFVVAPATEQSAKSHSFTMHEPLRVHGHGPNRWSVTGTPADAVYLALHGILPVRPDLVISGINRGSNLGTDVLYSGTVAAAREAASNDLPAIAVSLHVPDGSTTLEWATAQRAVAELVRRYVGNELPFGEVLNVNVPNVPAGSVKGWRVAPLARRRYAVLVKEQLDPRGRRYYWIGGPHDRFDGEPDADGPLCLAGHVTVTPMSLDTTAHDSLGSARRLGLEDRCFTS